MNNIYEVAVTGIAVKVLHVMAESAEQAEIIAEQAEIIAEQVYKNTDAISMEDEMAVNFEAFTMAEDEEFMECRDCEYRESCAFSVCDNG